MTTTKDALAGMFARRLTIESDNAEIEEKYGPLVAIYAMHAPKLFRMQRKYPEFFAGPHAEIARCCSVRAPLLADDGARRTDIIANPTAAHGTSTRAEMYYADLFARDASAITTLDYPLDPRHANVMIPVMSALRAIGLEPIPRPPKGSRAFVDRAEFDARLARAMTVMRRATDGAQFAVPDIALRAIFANASADAGDAGADTCASIASNTLGRNYCIAGGFIAKLIDPCARDADLVGSDVDIFVYGENQAHTIDEIVRALWVQGETYATAIGSVITIYRVGATRVQIVSSAENDPARVISQFDLANVMAFWARGTVWVNAPCMRAFATRVCVLKGIERGGLSIARIVKLVRAGFVLNANRCDARRARVERLTEDMRKMRASVLGIAAWVRISADMSEPERIARIALHDDSANIITRVSASIGDTPRNGDDGETLSSLIMLRRTIVHGYCSLDICDVDWNLVSIRDLPTAPGTHDSIRVAGFRARVNIEYVGVTIARRGTGGRMLTFRLAPEYSALFRGAINALRAKMLGNGLALDVDDVIRDASGNTSRASDDNTPRASVSDDNTSRASVSDDNTSRAICLIATHPGYDIIADTSGDVRRALINLGAQCVAAGRYKLTFACVRMAADR